MKVSKVVVPASDCVAVLNAMVKDDLLALAKVKRVSVRGSKAAVIDRMVAAKADVSMAISIL
jgi:hypothetical protein